MMESNFHSDDFERLIREKTEQYKMYPSEKAWKGVYSSLHTRKRWFFTGMSLLVTGIILVAGKELIFSPAHSGPLKKQALTASLTPPKIAPVTTLPAPFTEFRGPGHAAAAHNGQGSGPLADLPVSEETNTAGIVNPSATNGQAPDLNNGAGQVNDLTVTNAGSVTGNTTIAARGSSARQDAPGLSAGSTGLHAGSTGIRAVTGMAGAKPVAETYTGYLTRVRTGNGLKVGPDPYEQGQLFILTSALVRGNSSVFGLQIPLHPAATTRSLASLQADALLREVSADDDDDQTETPDAPATAVNDATRQKINWLQDYAVYSMHPSPRKKMGYWQLFFAPTVDVRALSGGNPVNTKTGMPPMPLPPSPAAAKRNTVANLFRDIGFEAGGSVLYRISRTLSVKAGLQFNYSKFMINTAGGGGTDSNAASGANATGAASSALHNEYYQLSAPVGLEMKVWGNDRLQVNIAATVQPAYRLNMNAYLPAGEGNGYIQAPLLFRRWNVDGGAEAYISYKIGGLRLQVGPEFRYQFLSSFTDRSPIRENLSSYGLKIGFTKAIR